MASNSSNFQDSQFDPRLPRNNVPEVVTKLYIGYGTDKTLSWFFKQRLAKIYTVLLEEHSACDLW